MESIGGGENISRGHSIVCNGEYYCFLLEAFLYDDCRLTGQMNVVQRLDLAPVRSTEFTLGLHCGIHTNLVPIFCATLAFIV